MRELNEQSFDRRTLLRGAAAAGVGLSFDGLLRARAARQARAAESAIPATPPGGIRACIFIFYYGGPSHLETFDPKPHAPAEVRGEFGVIQTRVPGLVVGEHLPHTAGVLHKAAVIRSMHHPMRLHDAACVETLTGRAPARGDGENFLVPREADLFPSLGAAYSYARRDEPRAVHNAALPFVINNVIPVPCQSGGFLGRSFDPFLIAGDHEALAYRAETLALQPDLSLERVLDRGGLLRQLDVAPSAATADATLLAGYYERAFDLLASEAVRQALHIDREDAATRDRYGLGEVGQSFQDGPNGDNGAQLGIGRNMRGQNLLLARRLVEAGVPFVNVYDFKQQGKNWDAHADNFNQHRNHLLPPMDRAFAALIEDLDERGLLESTLVVALGEFGRTPRINAGAGRDHWPDCYSAVVAGGGVRGGTVWGASDKLGAYPASEPVSPGDIAATVFWRFGIDPASHMLDAGGRPYKIAEGRPLTELFG